MVQSSSTEFMGEQTMAQGDSSATALVAEQLCEDGLMWVEDEDRSD